jgi:hypothetical protein
VVVSTLGFFLIFIFIFVCAVGVPVVVLVHQLCPFPFAFIASLASFSGRCHSRSTPAAAASLPGLSRGVGVVESFVGLAWLLSFIVFVFVLSFTEVVRSLLAVIVLVLVIIVLRFVLSV